MTEVAYLPTQANEEHLSEAALGLMGQGEMLMEFSDCVIVNGANGERLVAGSMIKVYEWLVMRNEATKS